MKYEAIVFDMDGVLIDSKQCMNMCWSVVQEEMSIKIDFQEYFCRIGKPFKIILNEIGVPEEQLSEVEKIYFSAQEKYMHEIKPYPNIDWMLKELGKEYVLGLVTSKNSKAAGLILSKFRWKFSEVITPDNCSRGKPYPDPLLYFTAYEQINPNKCIYVGDMVVDMLAANSAGYDFVRAGWGYQLFEAKSVESPSHLIEFIRSSK